MAIAQDQNPQVYLAKQDTRFYQRDAVCGLVVLEVLLSGMLVR